MKKQHSPDNSFDGLKNDLDTDSAMQRHARLSSDINSDFVEKMGAGPESFMHQGLNNAVKDSKPEHPVFSRLNAIFTSILVISLAGFSISNWMTHKQVAQLTTATADVQSRLAGMDSDKDKKRMENRMAGLEDSFRTIRLRLGQQPSDDGLVTLKLRLADAEKEIARLRLIMGSAIKQARTGRSKVTHAGQRTRTARSTKKAPKATLASHVPTHRMLALTNPGQSWIVNLETTGSESAAESALTKMHGFGIMAKKHEVERRGKKYWRLSVAGFRSRQAASEFVQNIAAKHGFADAWIYWSPLSP